MKEKKRVIVIAALVSVLVIAIAITSVFLLSPSASYSASIREAENYAERGDYENAVLSYKEAIEKDPDNVSAYLGLAEIYEMNGDLLLAIDVLEDGYAHTRSLQIRVVLNRLLESDEEAEEADGLSINRSLFSMFSAYRLKDYEERYGKSDGRRKARFDGLDAGITFDEDGVPVSIEVDDVLTLFNADEAFDASLLEEMRLEKLRTRHDGEHGEVVIFSYEDVRVTIGLEDGMITSSSFNELIPSLDDEEDKEEEEDEEKEEEEEKETVLYTGVTTDYLTEDVIGNVSMTVYRGKNSSGQKYLDLSSNENGAFQMNLECGRYFFIEMEKGEYTGEIELYVPENGSDYEGMNAALSKPLDDILIILEWESDEAEFVSELVTHQNGEKLTTMDTGVIPGVGGEIAAYKEVTDSDGVVRDVTTIVDEDMLYAFYVRRTDGNGTFGEANAVVTVRVPGMNDVVVEVDPKIVGEDWYVFIIHRGKVGVMNNGTKGYSII